MCGFSIPLKLIRAVGAEGKGGPPWARTTKNVKKPPGQICESCREAFIEIFALQIKNILGFSNTYDNLIKYEVSLHFWRIRPTVRPLRFGQISYPYLNQGRGADYDRHINTYPPPLFLDIPTALLTDDCLVTISYKKRQQLQFKCTVVLVFGLVFFWGSHSNQC